MISIKLGYVNLTNRKAAPDGAAFPLSFRSMCAVTARRSTAGTDGIT